MVWFTPARLWNESTVTAMNVLRGLLCGATLLSCTSVLADTPLYSAENAYDYLIAKDNIAVVRRISGGLSPLEYVSYLEPYTGSVDPDVLLQEWAGAISHAETSDLLVVKAIKGKPGPIVTLANSGSAIHGLLLNREYLVFFDTTAPTRIAFQEIFDIQWFPRDLLDAEPEVLVRHIETNLVLRSVEVFPD